MKMDSVNIEHFNPSDVKAGLREFNALDRTLDDLRFLPGFRVESLKKGLKDVLDQESEVFTFGQLADLAPRIVEFGMTGIGAGQERQLKRALLLTSRFGFEHFAADGHRVPRNLKEFVDTGLDLLESEYRELLVSWVAFDQTGSEVATRFGLNSRQAVDIRLKEQIRPQIMNRIGWYGREYIKPLQYLMKHSGGVCHVDALREIYEGLEPRKMVLACWLVSEGKKATFNLWNETFLLEEPRTTFETRIAPLRQKIRANSQSNGTIDIQEIQKILSEEFGIQLGIRYVESLMALVFEVEPDESGIYDIRRLQFRGEQIVTHLKAAAGPVHCNDLALPMYRIVNDGREPEPEEDLDGYARRAEAILERSDNVLQWTNRTFIHVENLPLSRIEIEGFREKAVDLILQEGKVVSVRSIAKSLGGLYPWIKEHDNHLLKGIICQDGRIQRLRKLLVAPSKLGFEATPSVLKQFVHNLLKSESRPWSANEVFERSEDEGLCFSIHSLKAAMATNDFSVNLGDGTMLAVEHLGIDLPLIEALRRSALEIMNSETRVWSTPQLQDLLVDNQAMKVLKERHGNSVPRVLWGILRQDSDRFAAGTWNSVAIKLGSDDANRVLSWEIVYLALTRLTVAFTGNLVDEIKMWWGWDVSPGSLDAALRTLVSQGRIARFPFGVFYPVDVQKAVLFEKLAPFRGRIESIIKDGLVTDFDDPQWKLVDEFRGNE